MDDIITDVKTIAYVLNMTTRRVQQMAKQSLIPRMQRGKYNLAECTRAYISYLEEKSEMSEIDHTKVQQEYDVEKVLHERAKRQKSELQLLELKGELHRSKDIERIWNNVAMTFRSRVMALSTKIAPQVQFIDDIKAILMVCRREISEVLIEMSRYSPESFNIKAADVDAEE